MIDLVAHSDGVVLRIRAQPGSRRNRIVGEHGGALKVAVAQPPEKGRANQAVAEVLCESLGLKKSQVRLQSGETSRDKWFLLIGVKPAELKVRLARIVSEVQG